jgi:hypothetical protein
LNCFKPYGARVSAILGPFLLLNCFKPYGARVSAILGAKMAKKVWVGSKK